jgi:hypothetical protein
MWGNFLELRNFFEAAIQGVGTPGVEMTPWRWIKRRGDLPFDGSKLATSVFQARYLVQQRPGIWMVGG